MNINALTLNTNILSLGSLLGTTGERYIVDHINERCGAGSFFGSSADPFRTGFSEFLTTIVEPIREVKQTLTETARRIFQRDAIRPITSVKELAKGIPPCMMLPILHHPPIRKLLDEERIDGFGFTSKDLDEEDPYGSVINSGVVEIHSSLLDKNGETEIGWTYKSTDPELSFQEQEDLYLTRKFLDDFLENEDTKLLDPTSYPDLRA